MTDPVKQFCGPCGRITVWILDSPFYKCVDCLEANRANPSKGEDDYPDFPRGPGVIQDDVH